MFNFKTHISLDDKGVHLSLINEQADTCLDLNIFLVGTTLRAKGSVYFASDVLVKQSTGVIPCNSFEETMRYIPELLNKHSIEPNEKKAQDFVKSAWSYEEDIRAYLNNKKKSEECAGRKQ
jgi:hypothetical protein